MSEQPHTDNTPHPATAGDVQSGSNVQETQFDLSKLAEAPAAEYSQPPPVSASVQQTPAVSEHQSAAHDLSALASAPQPHINNAFAGQDSDLSQLLPVLQDHSTSSSIPTTSNAPPSSGPGFFPPAGGDFLGSIGNNPVSGISNPQQSGGFFASQPSHSTQGDIPTNPIPAHDSSMPLLERAAAESLQSRGYPAPGQASASTSTTSANFPTPVNTHHGGDPNNTSSTFEEISRTAPWLLSASSAQPSTTSGVRTTEEGSYAQQSGGLYASAPDVPVHQPEDDDEDDDGNDDPTDQDYQPQAPGFMSNPLMRAAARNSSSGYKRTRASGEGADLPVDGQDVYLPESDEEDEYIQPTQRKKPRKSTGSINTSPGPHKCDFVDEHGQLCDTPFKRPYDLARHKETKHNLGTSGKSKQEWICKACKHNFSRKDALLRHQRVRHHNN